MSNTQHNAFDSLYELAQVVEPISHKAPHINWQIENRDVLYNTNQGILLELLEVWMQKEHEFQVSFWGMLWGLTEPSPWFRDIFKKSFLDSGEGNAISKEDLNRQLSKTKSILESDFLPVIVSHSQGNLFANSLYRLLENPQKQAVAISAVASPASVVEGGGPYVTLRSDGVIVQLAKAFSPPPLPPNLENSAPTPGFFDHNFISHYLKGAPAGEMVTKNTVDQMEALAKRKDLDTKSQPEPECIRWFERSGAAKEKDFFACHSACAVEGVGMGDFYCPLECDRLCGCESYGRFTDLIDSSAVEDEP